MGGGGRRSRTRVPADEHRRAHHQRLRRGRPVRNAARRGGPRARGARGVDGADDRGSGCRGPHRRREDRGHRCRRSRRDPGVRRQPHAPRLRRRSGRGVRSADGGEAVRGGRDPHHRRRDTVRLRRRTPRAPALPRRRVSRTGDDDARDQDGLRPRRRDRAAARATRRGGHRRGHVPRRSRRRARVRRARGRVHRPRGGRDARRRVTARPLGRRLLRDRRVHGRPESARARGGPGEGTRHPGARKPTRRGTGWHSLCPWTPPPSITAPSSRMRT